MIPQPHKFGVKMQEVDTGGELRILPINTKCSQKWAAIFIRQTVSASSQALSLLTTLVPTPSRWSRTKARKDGPHRWSGNKTWILMRRFNCMVPRYHLSVGTNLTLKCGGITPYRTFTKASPRQFWINWDLSSQAKVSQLSTCSSHLASLAVSVHKTSLEYFSWKNVGPFSTKKKGLKTQNYLNETQEVTLLEVTTFT